jgi:hypothetical protein
MSRQLDQMIAEAGTKNFSLAQALESLADMELESRNRRAIERRFRCSRLQAQHSIDSFHFKHHKSRMELKNRILRLLDLEFLAKGTSAIFIGNPGVGKTFLAKIIAWRACQGQSACSFHYGHGHAESPARFPGGSLAHLQTQTLYRAHSPGLRRTRLSLARSANLESLLSGHLHSPQSQTFYDYHHQYEMRCAAFQV